MQKSPYFFQFLNIAESPTLRDKKPILDEEWYEPFRPFHVLSIVQAEF